MSKVSKKKRKSVVSTMTDATSVSSLVDPLPPIWIPPPAELGAKLLEALEYRPLDDKDLFGFKIPARVLKHLSPAEIKDLIEVFQTFDRDAINMLKTAELHLAMKALGFSFCKKDCEEYISQQTELSGLKGINLVEFLELIIEKQHISKDHHDEITKVFHLFDYDRSGYLSFGNLKNASIEANFPLSDTELKEMIEEADTDGDGMIDLNEFVNIMMKTNLY